MKKAIRLILTLIQIMIIIPPFILQYYSGRKMGMMRYLVYKQRIFEKDIFSPKLMVTYKVLFIISMLCFLLFFIKKFKNKYDIYTGVIISSIGIIFIFSKSLNNLLAYYFFLIALAVQIILQFAKITLYKGGIGWKN